MSEPFAVTDQSFEADVLDSSQPVLVDFWAEWCAPCKMIAPIVEELARDYAGKLRVAKLDADTNPNVMQAFGVMGIPTLIPPAKGRRWTIRTCARGARTCSRGRYTSTCRRR